MARSDADIPRVTLIIDLPLPDLFSSLVKGLLTDVVAVAPKGWLGRPPIKLLWRRLRRMTTRFAAIMAQLHAGTLPPPAAPRSPAPPRPADASPPSHGSPPSDGSPPPHEPRLPDPTRRVGWVIRAIPGASIWGGQFKEMLANPKLPTAYADAPQLGSVLRPMCHMMAVRQPAWLRLPRPPRPRRVVEIPPAPDWLVNEPGAILRPDGTVWMRIGASTKWRPGFGETLAQAQRFDPPIRIWPRTEWK